MHGFEHGAPLADIGGRGEPHRARHLGGDIGDDVAIEVRRQDDVEGLRRVGDAGRTDVDDHVLLRDLRIVGAHLLKDPTEQPVGGLHDVVLGQAGDFSPVLAAREFEGVARDPLAPRPGDQLQALDHVRRLAVLDARIEILFVLADDHQVHPGMPRGDEGRIGDTGPDIGVEAEGLPDGDVERLHPAALGRGDRRLVEDAGAPQAVPDARRETRGMTLAPDCFADLDEFRRQARAPGLQDAQAGLHDLRPYAVAERDCDGGGGERGHGQSPDESRVIPPLRRPGQSASLIVAIS